MSQLIIGDSGTVDGVGDVYLTFFSYIISNIPGQSDKVLGILLMAQIRLADGTEIHSSVVLSNATPYKTFMVFTEKNCQ